MPDLIFDFVVSSDEVNSSLVSLFQWVHSSVGLTVDLFGRLFFHRLRFSSALLPALAVLAFALVRDDGNLLCVGRVGHVSTGRVGRVGVGRVGRVVGRVGVGRVGHVGTGRVGRGDGVRASIMRADR